MPAPNYIVRKLVAITRQSDVLYGGEVDSQDKEASPVDTWTLTLDDLKFMLVDGISVPTKGTLKAIRQDKNGDIYTIKTDIERNNIVLERIKNCFGVFCILRA